MTKVKREKSFAVYGIFIQMQSGFAFIYTESAAIAQSICRETLMIHQKCTKNGKLFSRSFCCLRYVHIIAMRPFLWLLEWVGY